MVLNSHGTVLDSYLDQNLLPQTTTTESPYHPYEPQTNYYVGAFLIAVGKCTLRFMIASFVQI